MFHDQIPSNLFLAVLVLCAFACQAPNERQVYVSERMDVGYCLLMETYGNQRIIHKSSRESFTTINDTISEQEFMAKYGERRFLPIELKETAVLSNDTLILNGNSPDEFILETANGQIVEYCQGSVIDHTELSTGRVNYIVFENSLLYYFSGLKENLLFQIDSAEVSCVGTDCRLLKPSVNYKTMLLGDWKQIDEQFQETFSITHDSITEANFLGSKTESYYLSYSQEFLIIPRLLVDSVPGRHRKSRLIYVERCSEDSLKLVENTRATGLLRESSLVRSADE